VFAVEQGILPPSTVVTTLRQRFPLEVGLLVGSLLMVSGIVLSGYSVLAWDRADFGPFDPRYGMRLVIPSLLLTVVGAQLLFAAMFMGVLDLRSHQRVGR
jgi:hypothetical protein